MKILLYKMEEYKYSFNLDSETHPRKDIFKMSENRDLRIYYGGIEISLQEIDILFRINNPNIVRGYKISRIIKNSNRNLQNITTNSTFGKITDKLSIFQTSELCLKFCEDIYSAQKCLQDNGYYNLDLSLKNIVYSDIDGEINFYLGNFDVCIPISQKDEIVTLPEYTESSENIVGNRKTISPETQNEKQIYPNSFLWSLGILILQILTRDEYYPFSRMGNIFQTNVIHPPYSDFFSRDNDEIITLHQNRIDEILNKAFPTKDSNVELLSSLLKGMLNPYHSKRLKVLPFNYLCSSRLEEYTDVNNEELFKILEDECFKYRDLIPNFKTFFAMTFSNFNRLSDLGNSDISPLITLSLAFLNYLKDEVNEDIVPIIIRLKGKIYDFEFISG